MSRSEVTICECTRNASNAVTKDEFDIAEGHSIDVSEVQDEDLVLLIETSDTKAATFTVKAGTGVLSSQGDLSISTAAAGLIALDLESARFKGATGLILIDITSAAEAAGNIAAIKKK